jgi:excisionase family DNA binding protein
VPHERRLEFLLPTADLPAVQRIMRHTDPRITTEFSGHLAPGYLRSAIDRLAFEVTPTEPTGRVAVASAPSEPALASPLITQFAAPLLQTRKSSDREPSDTSEKGPRVRYLSGSGREDSNLRHPDPKNGDRPSHELAPARTASQEFGRIGTRSDADLRPVPPIGRFGTHFTAHTLHAPLGELLNIAAVAERLKVCTATVYKLCTERWLPHVRVRNAIRVAARDLDEFVREHRTVR